MTAEAFLDEELETAESFLDAPDPAPAATAEEFLDEPERQATPILLDDRFPTDETATTPLEPVNLFGATPGQTPAPIDMGAEQANSLARDAIADTQARRGIFSPDSPPYRLLGDQYAIDPLRYDDAAAELWKEGLIDSDQYFRMMRDAEDIKTAATRRRDLERQAGANPELKAALHGLARGGVQLASALVVGSATGAGTGPALGPGAVPAAIAAGVGSSILAGDMFDTFAAKIAEEDKNIASILAAKELFPGYDTAGQFASVLIPAPAAVTRLKSATSLIATERGAAEAAKFAARVTGTGAGIGLGTDLAVQGGIAAIDLSSDRPISFSPESLGISTALGALTAGLGVKANNRVYFADELPVLEQKVKLGTASREDTADYWTMRRTIEILREDQRLLEAGAIARSTVDFMGTRVLDTNTVINPRFQRDILTQAGFEPPFSSTNQPAPPPAGRPALPYAAENPAAAIPAPAQAAPAYTGQAFIDRGGPAPAFQGGTTALPGPAGVQALPGPAAVNLQVNPPTEPPALPAPPTEPPVVSNDTVPAPPTEPSPKLQAAAATPEPVRQSQPVDPSAPALTETEIDIRIGIANREIRNLETQRKSEALKDSPRKKIIYEFDDKIKEAKEKLKSLNKEKDKFYYQKLQEQDAKLKNALEIEADKITPRSASGPLSQEETVTLNGLRLDEQINGKLGQISQIAKDRLEARASAAPPTEPSPKLQAAAATPAPPVVSNDTAEPVPPAEVKTTTSKPTKTPPAQATSQAAGKVVNEIERVVDTAGIKPAKQIFERVVTTLESLIEESKPMAGFQTVEFRPTAQKKYGLGSIFIDGQYVASVGKYGDVRPNEEYALKKDLPQSFDIRDLGPAGIKQKIELTVASQVARRTNNGQKYVVRIPGDGTFKIEANPLAVAEVLRRIKSAGPSAWKGVYEPAPTETAAAPSSKSSGSKSKADAGPVTPPAAQVPKPAPVKPQLAELNDAQIFADYPNAVAVHRGPGWAVPVILGGTDKVPVFQSPEIVEFYRTLAMQDPTLKNFNKALGRFYSDTGRVAVRPDLFLDENSALMTLSHEIGHFWSWADEGEIRLGNLGGHIQNIHNFLKTTFPIDRGGKLLTEKDRKQIRKAAEKEVGPRPAADEEADLAAWREEVARVYREKLQEEITTRRLAYVGPQRGGFEDGAYDPNIREELIAVSEWWKPFDYDTVPDSYLRYRHSAAELFADAISVLFMSPADLKQRAPNFWEALFNHMDARPQVKAKYLDIANRILRGREAVLDHRISRDMQNFAKADEIFMAIHDEAASRRASITGLRDDFLDQMWDQYYPITSALRAGQRQGKLTLAEDDPYRYLTEEHPMSDSIVQLAMADMGRLMARLDAAGIPRYELDMYLKDSRIAFEKQEIQAEVDGIMQAVGWEGSATKANPDGETPTTAADKLARQAELLGPEKTALLKATAAQWRDIFHDFVREAWKKGVLTDEAWQRFNSNDSYATFTVLKHIRDFATARIVGRKGTFQSVGRPTVEMMKKMVALHREAQRNEFRAVMIPRLRESLPDVVRDAPMRFNGKAMVPQEPQDRGWELITWREKGQLRGVHIQTRWARAFQVNSPGIENAILRALNTGFRETIYNLIIRYNPSFQLGTGPIMDFTRSFRNMPGGVKGRVAFIKEMTREVFELAKSRDGRRILIEGAGSFGGVVTGGPAGAIVGGVGGVPGMALGGVLGANTAGAAGFYLGRMVANLVERALPWLPDNPAAALDWARGDFGRSAVIRDMVENYAISGPWNYVGRGMTADPDDSMGALFVKFAQAGKPESSNFLWKHLQNLFRDIEFAGQTLQLVPKTAAYRVMTGKMDMSKRESAYWIRNHIGLPNTAKKGSHIRNVEALLPFANVWARSLESMGKLLSGMDRRTMSAKEWWMAFILGGGGLYAVFQALASEGVFGEDIKKVYDGASEYVKSNLVAIPLGTVPSPTGDKSALLTVPLDHESRLLFGLIYKTTRAGIRATKGQPLDVGPSDLVTGFAATTPGLNPLLDVGRNWMDFGMGKQPIDHRNLPILTEDERRVGGTAALKPMLGWTLEETGIANFFKWDPKANTFTEAALKPMPSINRFLRITDAGIRETERKLIDEEQLVRSRFKLGFPMWMQALRSEASYLQRKGDARNFREADRHMELRFWRRQYDKALEQMETAHELGNKSEVMAVRNQLIQDSQMFRPRD